MAQNSCYITQLETIQRVTQPDLCTLDGFFLTPLVGDFIQNSRNCIFRNECPNLPNFTPVMTVCYAYCILKCCIIIMISFYQSNRLQYIQKKLKSTEIKTYYNSMRLNILIELLMALRDFFLFRGLGYFVSYLYEIVFVQSNDGEGAFTSCISPSDSGNLSLNNIQFYLMTGDTCLSRFPFFSLGSDENVDQQTALTTFSIIFWILTECASSSILFFNTQVLVSVNEEGKEVRDINRGIFKHSIMFFFAQLTLISVLIFCFQFRLYFRFSCVEVLTFQLAWKAIGFLLLLDSYNQKKYNFSHITIFYQRIQIHWSDKNREQYENVVRPFDNYPPKQHQINEEIQTLNIANQPDSPLQDRKRIFENKLEKIKDAIEEHCKEYDEKNKSIEQFRWESYIFFVLCTLFLGIVGLSCCLVHYNTNLSTAQNLPNSIYTDNPLIDLSTLNSSSGTIQVGKYLIWEPLYWIGFILCMLESAIFEIFNSVMLIYSYCLEYFNRLSEKEKLEQ